MSVAIQSSRIARTATFRGGRLPLWQQCRCAIIGAGTVGSRLAIETVRSGADVLLVDFDRGELANTENQAIEPGVLKTESVVATCDRIRPGAAIGVAVDVQHLGVGMLAECDIIVDATDDARLAFVLTEIANGLETPLFRVAVDGSGSREYARVLCSHPLADGACQLCPYSFEDLTRVRQPTPCLGAATDDGRPPTLAGGALAGVAASTALLQMQRVVTGNDIDAARNRETLLDLTSMQLMNVELRRSAKCISGHQRWELESIDATRVRTFGDVFAVASERLQTDQVSIEPYNHPLCLGASCECGVQLDTPGTVWAAPPICPQCGASTQWHRDIQRRVLSRDLASRIQADARTLTELGFPEAGAMFTARTDDNRILRLIVK